MAPKPVARTADLALRAGRARWLLRAGWTMASFFLVEVIVCGLSALPAVVVWEAVIAAAPTDGVARLLVLALAAVPSYVLFALCLMVVSPAVTFVLGWRTPPDAALRIADLDWPLLAWVRYVAATRVVRVLAGTLFLGSPVWTTYIRLNGARIGRRAFVNSLFVSDHNLLELGDDVVIGAGAHVSGHTVEDGVVKTGRVRLARGVTVGIGSVIDIDVDAGEGCQIGALSLVPKHSRLERGAVYVGIPVRRVPQGSARIAALQRGAAPPAEELRK